MKSLYCLCWLLILPLPGRSEDIAGHQFTFFDDILTQDPSGVPALTRRGPENLLSPANYVGGRLYLRLEILAKPSELPLRPAFFIWQNSESGLRHIGVRRDLIPDYTTAGIYYLDCAGPSEWWNGKYALPDWTRPFDKIALVPWVGNSQEQLYTQNCYNHCYTGGDIQRHTPILYRATGIWVAAGKKLVPPPNWKCPPEWTADPSSPSPSSK